MTCWDTTAHKASESNCAASADGISIKAASTPAWINAPRVPGPVAQQRPGQTWLCGRASKKDRTAWLLTNMAAWNMWADRHACVKAWLCGAGPKASRGKLSTWCPAWVSAWVQARASASGRVKTSFKNCFQVERRWAGCTVTGHHRRARPGPPPAPRPRLVPKNPPRQTPGP